MVRLISRSFSQKEWDHIVSLFPDLSLVQTWAYGEAKAHLGPWKAERAILVREGQLVGACQAMVRFIPGLGRGMVWINRGPLWRRHDNSDISELLPLLDAIRRYWVEERSMYLRLAPPLYQEEADPNLFSQHGLAEVTDGEGWASARVDLSLPTEVLLSRFQQKWRNCLNKAIRMKISWESGTSDRIFEQVLEEFQKTMVAKNFSVSAPPPFLRRMRSYLGEDHKLWGLLATQGEERLGGMLIARYGQISEYMIGAFSDAGRMVNAGNFLLWQAICQMKDQSFRWLDLGGMHPVSTPKGIFHFKSGLGGIPYQFFGELESYRNTLLNQVIRWQIKRQTKGEIKG